MRIEFTNGLQRSISSIELLSVNGWIVKKFDKNDWKNTDNGVDLDLSDIQQGTYGLL